MLGYDPLEAAYKAAHPLGEERDCPACQGEDDTCSICEGTNCVSELTFQRFHAERRRMSNEFSYEMYKEQQEGL